jgi:hypothetical protein
LLVTGAAFADPGKDESGHGKRRGHERSEYKETYRDWNCKVERTWKRDGDYKEERKCRSPRPEYTERPAYGYYEPEPIYAPAPRSPVYGEPGITIQGTFRLPN